MKKLLNEIYRQIDTLKVTAERALAEALVGINQEPPIQVLNDAFDAGVGSLYQDLWRDLAASQSAYDAFRAYAHTSQGEDRVPDTPEAREVLAWLTAVLPIDPAHPVTPPNPDEIKRWKQKQKRSSKKQN